MEIIINPGSGPVDGTTTIQAAENMKHFITDHDEKDLAFVAVPELDYGDGRFAFLLYKKDSTRCHEIQMPGTPLENVRYTDGENQNIWDFPRLYVDGSSWVWGFAILDHENDWIEPY